MRSLDHRPPRSLNLRFSRSIELRFQKLPVRIAYELTSAAQSLHGGMAAVAREIAARISRDSTYATSGFFAHGERKRVGLAHLPIHRISPLRTFLTGRVDIAHMLCHRWLPIKARRYLYTVHDVWSLQPNLWQPAAFQAKAGARLRLDIMRADMVVAVSHATRTALLNSTDLHPDRCVVIPSGVTISPPAKQQPLPPIVQSPYLLFVGRLERRKNIPHLLAAAKPISGLQVVLVGEPGHGYAEDVVPLLREFPADRLRIFSGLASATLHTLYAHALCSLQPSWEEGFGLPILEAMASGCPVITSNRSACPEVAGADGLLVDPEEPEQARQLIERLRDDHFFRAQARSNGYARAELFRWESTINQLGSLYQQQLQ